MTETCICGHPKVTHRYQGGNQHTTFTYLGECKAEECDCNGWGVWIEGADGDDTDDGREKVECRVCGQKVGRGPAGLGTKQHARKHRREFAEQYGRGPHDYQEVRDRLGRPAYNAKDDDQQLTLAESADERAREARHDDAQAPLDLDPVAEEGVE